MKYKLATSHESEVYEFCTNSFLFEIEDRPAENRMTPTNAI